MFQLLKSWLGRSAPAQRVETPAQPQRNVMVTRNLVERNGRGKRGIQGKVTFVSTGAMNIDFYRASAVNIADVGPIADSLKRAYQCRVEVRHSIDNDGHNVLNMSAISDQRTRAVIALLTCNTSVCGGTPSFQRRADYLVKAFRRLNH